MIRQLLTDRYAQLDAKKHTNSVEERLLALYGLPKDVDPANNLADRQALADLQSPEIDEYTEQLHRIEDQQAHHEAPLGLTLKLAGCFAAEVLGCTLLFRDLGLSGVERFGLGVLFAAFIFWITAQATRGSDGGGRRFFLLTIIAYALVMLSVTVLRTISASTEDGSRLEELSIGIVMLATSIGGAFLAESIMRKRAPAVRLAKEHRNIERRRKQAVRRREAARRYLQRREHQATDYRERVARTRARYSATHKLNQEEES